MALVEQGWSRVYWKSSQVSYSLRPEEIKVGMKLGILDCSLAEYEKPPTVYKFLKGRVVKIWGNPSDPLMTIEFDEPRDCGALDISCGVKEYARFCIRDTSYQQEKVKWPQEWIEEAKLDVSLVPRRRFRRPTSS